MLKHFAIYSFLRTQRYFEPFLYLFFLEQGLSFTQIGILAALEAFFVNLLEVPSGGIADLYGKRKTLIFSFLFYIISFSIYGFGNTFFHFISATTFFACGEAFRSGTHKAMIFSWLRINNSIDKKSKIYGYTRSWSKIGAAVSIPIAATILFFTGHYKYTFLFSIIPCFLLIFNFSFYPSVLDAREKIKKRPSSFFHFLIDEIKESFRNIKTRIVLIESMAYEGSFRTVKNYLQPLIKTFLISIPIFQLYSSEKRIAILSGLIYFTLNIFSSIASRQTHKLSDLKGSDDNAAKFVYLLTSLLYLALIPLLFMKLYLISITLFILIHVLYNFWRPLLIGRLGTLSRHDNSATLLSIENQSNSLIRVILAPLIGVFIDLALKAELEDSLFPVAGLALTVLILAKLVLKLKNNHL